MENAAAKVLLQIETASLKKKGEEITPEKEAALYDKIKSRYDNQVPLIMQLQEFGQMVL